MKLLIAIFTLLLINCSVAQGQSDLIGTWKLKNVVETSGKKSKDVKRYKLIIYANKKYAILFGGTSWISGEWEQEGNKIKFESQTVSDPCMEWSFDHEFKPFEIADNGILIIDIFICGTVDGRSYFKRIQK